MTTALTTQTTFDREQIDLIKRTIAVGATDDELKLFVMQAQRMGLDPFARQIHAVKRKVWNPETRETEDRMTIQVGIDGYRLVADRTGRYAPGRASTYEYDKEGKLMSATAYVMKMVGQQWHECAATAHFDEYAQTKKDGTPTAMWNTKPHIMLGKCAEALALRRAFPAELSGVYTDDEMGQADTVAPVTATVAAHSPALTAPHAPALAAPAAAWKDELKQLGLAAKEWIPISSTEVAAELAAAQNIARDVLTRNGSTTEDERIAARAALQAAIAKAEQAVPA